MVSLKNGVLVKLLEEMEMEEKDLDDVQKSVLLQIRSIIPVLEEGTLWPNRGFFLKVSDMAHQMFVSLPQEENDMILGNKLKLGQLVYVQKLEKASPVPLLRGITPVPGRHPCEGTPEDIVSPGNLVKFLQASNMDSIVEKGVILEKKKSESSSDSSKLPRGLSDSESLRKGTEDLEGRSRRRVRSLSASKAHPGENKTEKCHMGIPAIEKKSCNIGAKMTKSSPSSVDNSDSDSVISPASPTHTSKRRSWTESDILRVKEIFNSSVVKPEIRPTARSHSTNVSPVRSGRYASSDESSSSTSKRRDVASAKRIVKVSNKGQIPISKVDNGQMSTSLFSLVYDRKGAETGISWSSLPSSLVKLGKEVVRQRDVALLAAADALQEACATERLLNSLSTFSEFNSAEGDDLQPYVDKFFDLQDELSLSRLIMQSLTSISPIKTSETEFCGTNSIKETLNIALERKKNASTWIKSAVALDLSPHRVSLTSMPNPTAATNTVKKSSPSIRSTKPKGACIIRKNRSSVDVPLLLSSDMDDQQEWTRGSTLYAAADLATSLQDECRKLFLGCVEKYLDEVERKSSLMESDSHMAGMMYKVKRVSDWLDMIVDKEGDPQNPNTKEGFRVGSYNLEDSANEAYGRVRNKIYGILMKHVERTAMAYASNIA
ncbi:Uncharacterized protein Adt_26498 [Abeliophyllum distichum]|uniref:Uncharacterized protein n=1 Tax=Abeliophyllum distichum TaxID=126358 RepID=A0ABD1RR23_9LAMI